MLLHIAIIYTLQETEKRLGETCFGGFFAQYQGRKLLLVADENKTFGESKIAGTVSCPASSIIATSNCRNASSWLSSSSLDNGGLYLSDDHVAVVDATTGVLLRIWRIVGGVPPPRCCKSLACTA